MTRIASFLFGLVLLALLIAHSLPRSFKHELKSALESSPYHRPALGFSLPPLPNKADPKLGSGAGSAGMVVPSAVDPGSGPNIPLSHKPVFREREGVINRDLFEPDIAQVGK